MQLFSLENFVVHFLLILRLFRNENENVFSPVDKPKKKKPAVSFAR